MLGHISMSCMQAHTINNTGMAFRIVYHHIMTAAQHIDDAYHSLVTIVKECCIFLTYKFGKFSFKLFVVVAVATHHAGTHWVGEAELFGAISIGFAHIRVVGKAQIIVQAPYHYFLSTKLHAAANITFQFWKCKIAMCSF